MFSSCSCVTVETVISGALNTDRSKQSDRLMSSSAQRKQHRRESNAKVRPTRCEASGFRKTPTTPIFGDHNLELL
jgi:hypothetical protein